MKRATRFVKAIILGATVSLAAGIGTAQAQDERELGWFLTGEVTGVWTSGNSESNTLGLAATVRREGHALTFHHLSSEEPPETVADRALKNNPDVVGFSFINIHFR